MSLMRPFARLARPLLSAGLALSVLASCTHPAATPQPADTGMQGLRAAEATKGSFPQGFLWGVATAGYQCEGGDTTSNWAVWEHAGRTSEPIGKAADFWNRYEEDAALAASMGMKAFRLSIEWARIEPQEGQIDQDAVKHYHAVLAALKSRGLEPVVTVSHWAYPAWLDTPDARGRKGWDSDRMPAEMARYAGWVAKEYGPEVKWWLTLNEPNTLGPGGYLAGIHPPGRHDFLAYRRVMDHQVAAHKLMYTAIHANDSDAMVSLCPIAVHRPEEKAHYTAESLTLYLDERDILDQLVPHTDDGKLQPLPDGKRYLDYMAFNYFFSLHLLDFLKIPLYRWPVYPQGIYEVSKELYARYKLPLMVTENGLSVPAGQAQRFDGWSREAYIVNHLIYLQKAVNEGIPVLGYMHWALTDNYEWGSYKPQFGLFSLDARDPGLTRVRTPAADVYGAIARANQVTDALQTRYAGHKN